MNSPQPSLSRRQTIAWMAAAAATSGPFVFAGSARAQPGTTLWPKLTLPTIEASGYGTDPDLAAKTVTWPLLLSDSECTKLRIAADIILPPGAGQAAPSALGIDAFINEWVSAPYTRQMADRTLIRPGLVWLDAEASARFGRDFTAASDEQRRAIFDMIAYPQKAAADDKQPSDFFLCLRGLTILGYYTTPQGMEELGFAGNTAIAGVYPGPGPEALAHLARKLKGLGLEMPK